VTIQTGSYTKRTMLKNKILLIFSLLFLLPFICHSQNDDFGIWYGLNAEKSLNKKIDISLSGMIRTFNDASKIEQSFLEGGVSYKIWKHISVAGSYRIINYLESYSEYWARHKFFADIKGTLPIGNFSLSSRFRLQLQKRTFIEHESDKAPDYHGRIKLKFTWKVPHFPVNPYLSAESFFPLSGNPDRTIDKNRFAFGADYNISKKHSVALEYIFQRDYTPHISDISIISLGYTFSM
jgi:hypothetical protein